MLVLGRQQEDQEFSSGIVSPEASVTQNERSQLLSWVYSLAETRGRWGKSGPCMRSQWIAQDICWKPRNWGREATEWDRDEGLRRVQKLGAESWMFSVQAICVASRSSLAWNPTQGPGRTQKCGPLPFILCQRRYTKLLSCGLCHAEISPSAFPLCSHMKRDGYIFIWKAIVNHTSAMPNMVSI